MAKSKNCEIIRSYLRDRADSEENTEYVRAFHRWAHDVSQEAQMQSYQEHPDVKRWVEAFISEHGEPQAQRCFDTALDFGLYCSGRKFGTVLYCEGYQRQGSNHAWNCFEGFYFDLTCEIALAKQVSRSELDPFPAYLQLIALEPVKAMGYRLKAQWELSKYVFDQTRRQ